MPSIADKNVGIIRKHIEYNLNTLNNNSLNDVRKFPQVNPNEVKKNTNKNYLFKVNEMQQKIVFRKNGENSTQYN